MNQKKYLYFIWAIFLLALAARIIYLLQTKDNPVFFPGRNELDPALYQARAELIAKNIFSWRPDFIYGTPLYPYFLAGIYRLFGANIFAARLIQTLLGALSCLLIYFISARVFNRRGALISMLICSLYGILIFYEGLLVPVSLTILLTCLIMLLLLTIQENSRPLSWFALGLLVGLGSLNYPSLLLFIPLVLIWFGLSGLGGVRQKFLAGLTFLAAVVTVIAPITLRNYRITGEFIPISAHSGINFYIGNNPRADGTFQPLASTPTSAQGLLADSIREAQLQSGRPLTPAQVSRFWFAKSGQFIKAQPLKYARLLLRKVALLFNGAEIFDVEDYGFFRKNFPTVLNFPLPNFRLVAPLALLGLVLSARYWKKCLPLYLLLGAFSVSIVAYFVNVRYRLPMAPFLIIFAGFTIDWWATNLKSKNFKLVLLSLAVLVVLILATNLKLVAQDEVSQYNNLGVAYKESGQYELAIAAYKEALKLQPALAQTRSNLGNLYNATGQYALAVQELKQALVLDNNLAVAHHNLGIAYTALGKINLAIAEYKKAIKLRPDLSAARENLRRLENND